MEGTRIGSYRVRRKIGQGGMGAVYEAEHEQLGRKAAIKLLRKELSQDPQIAMRFLNEGRAASRVEHSGIVQIFEFGFLPDQTAYIIMEFLRGEPLSARLRAMGGKLPLSDTIRISRQIASALAATHDKGIVHRDLKPDNVMLVPDSEMPGGERVKILDFGVAKVTDQGGPGIDDFKTNTGMVLGTASYMAPEQCKGAGNVTDRADVYSLGIVMYRMLIGQLPFRAEGQGEVMAMHIFSKARALRDLDPNVPEPMAALVERMMSKEQSERPSMLQVAAELDRIGGLIQPGGQPVMVMVAGGPMSSGQMPTAPTLSAALNVGGRSDSGADKSQPPDTTPDVVPPGRSWLLYLVIAFVLTGGATAAALHFGLLRPIIARLLPPPPPPPPPPPAEKVYWTVNSIPIDAQVLRKSDGSSLGTTPWQREQIRGTGKLIVVVRKPGYKDEEVVLDENTSMNPTVALTVLPDLGATAAATDLGAAASAAPTDLAAATPVITQPATPNKPATPIGTKKPVRPRPPKEPGSDPDTLDNDTLEIPK